MHKDCEQDDNQHGDAQQLLMSAKVVQLKRSRKQRNATSSIDRQGNEVYRVREHLTEAEIEKLLAALSADMAICIGPYGVANPTTTCLFDA
jgi:hypothetical protein